MEDFQRYVIILCIPLFICWSTVGQEAYVPYALDHVHPEYNLFGYSAFDVNYDTDANSMPDGMVYTDNQNIPVESNYQPPGSEPSYMYNTPTEPEDMSYVQYAAGPYLEESHLYGEVDPASGSTFDFMNFLNSLLEESPPEEEQPAPMTDYATADNDIDLLKQLIHLANELAESKLSSSKKDNDDSSMESDMDEDDDEDDDSDYDDDTDAYHRKTGSRRKQVQSKNPKLNRKGYGNQKRPPVKDKLIFSRSGFFVRGGSQLPGYFRGLQRCMDACNRIPNCLAVDYNRHAKLCYTHYETACDALLRDPSSIHLSKIPCGRDLDVAGLVDATVTIGRYGNYGFFMPWIKNIQECIHGCATAGGGLADTPVTTIGDDAVFNTTSGAGGIQDSPQLCFGVDYDVVDHRCWMHFRYWFFNSTTGQETTICDTVTGSINQDYLDQLGTRSSIVHTVLCPLPDDENK